MAGLAAARALSDRGCDLVVVDRGRRPGGRTSTRRVTADDERTIAFDHGAPYFSVTDPHFGRFVRSWVATGVCAEWSARRMIWLDGAATSVAGPTLVVGRPGMSAVCRHLARDLDVRLETVVEAL
jgi:predicted NAD/FAD-dependent oxidoreductase